MILIPHRIVGMIGVVLFGFSCKFDTICNEVYVPLCGIFQKASAAVVGSRGGATSPPTSVVAACAGAGAGRPQPPCRATPQTSPHTTLYPSLNTTEHPHRDLTPKMSTMRTRTQL